MGKELTIKTKKRFEKPKPQHSLNLKPLRFLPKLSGCRPSAFASVPLPFSFELSALNSLYESLPDWLKHYSFDLYTLEKSKDKVFCNGFDVTSPLLLTNYRQISIILQSFCFKIIRLYRYMLLIKYSTAFFSTLCQILM